MDEKSLVLFKLAGKYEALKDQLKLTKKELDSVLVGLGIDTYHQDPETLIVYKIVKPSGTFVEYRDIGYERTAADGEKKGSLSKKEAEARGFNFRRNEE